MRPVLTYWLNQSPDPAPHWLGVVKIELLHSVSAVEVVEETRRINFFIVQYFRLSRGPRCEVEKQLCHTVTGDSLFHHPRSSTTVVLAFI